MRWDAQLYDNKHDFVAEYGKGLLEFIPNNPKQTILDLGCGTGKLTAQLMDLGGKVIGVDSSQSMIDTATVLYDGIRFIVCDALNLPFKDEFDLVFSNAVFHWIHDHNVLAQNIYKVLKSEGMLICEFGASGNIATIEDAFSEQCAKYGYSYSNKFNFPKTESFRKLLEKHGFYVDRIYDFDRPTPLKDGDKGLENWIRQFYASELEFVPDVIQKEIIRNVEDIVRDELWNGETWIADYRRLRVIAHI